MLTAAVWWSGLARHLPNWNGSGRKRVSLRVFWHSSEATKWETRLMKKNNNVALVNAAFSFFFPRLHFTKGKGDYASCISMTFFHRRSPLTYVTHCKIIGNVLRFHTFSEHPKMTLIQRFHFEFPVLFKRVNFVCQQCWKVLGHSNPAYMALDR